jgi:hypothetical protein
MQMMKVILMNQIDFLATQPQYLDHIAPIWDTLAEDNLGTFYVPHELLGHAHNRLKHHLYLFTFENNSPDTFGVNPILVAAYGDMKYAHRINPERKIFMMEHGTGHSFGTSAYPNGPGERDIVSLFLPPNQYTADKIHTVRDTPCEVIGTPKLDWLRDYIFPRNVPPTVCISFHHGTKNRRPPEASSAFEHYKDTIASLKQQSYNLIAHGHPLSRVRDKPFYASLGIPFLDDFEDVMKVADVYVNDLSSTLYEFMATGKPVVVLNAPWFRRDVHHGLRFWDYSDVGINVNEPHELKSAIDKTLSDSTLFLPQRKKAIQDLFPYLGHSAERAAAVIREQLAEEKDAV